MDNKIEVIGIDHGWSGMKTVHTVVFLPGNFGGTDDGDTQAV